MKRLLTLALLAALGAPSMAQWGLRATILHFETPAPRGTWNFLAGLDHDLNDRMAVGLDFTVAFNLFGEPEAEQGEYEGYLVDYALQRKVMGLTYRSCYFFSDNDNGASAYVGPFIGFRRITYDLAPYVTTFYGLDQPAWARPVSEETIVFPVGMRFGFRGALDGYSGDIYVGVGTTLGDKDMPNAPYLLKKDRLGGLFLQAGYSYGIGW
ncbi:MAG: hypothetical protein R2815_07580 [Flavobacteriales bacterium]|nr:hypothetical protein [Flavobacteriales bacterium]